MQSRIDAIRAAGADVVAICVDGVEENARVAKRLELDFPILSDRDLLAIDAYGLRHQAASMEGHDIARPAVFVIDGAGIVRWRSLTDNWRVRVRPEEILKRLSDESLWSR